MLISSLDPNNLTEEQMTKLLFCDMGDDFQKGDCIIVLGSSKAVEYRLPKAIELYKNNRAPKILFSGGVTWSGQQYPEAIMMKNKALSLGIPEHDMLVEMDSKHTKENVLASLLVLDREIGLHHIKRLLLVTTIYHMRRAYLSFKTYMPSWIEYSLCPVNDLTKLKDSWFNKPYSRKRVETESRKIIEYIKQGILLDEDLQCLN